MIGHYWLTIRFTNVSDKTFSAQTISGGFRHEIGAGTIVSEIWSTYDAFTLDVKSMLNENLGGILGGTQCLNGRYLNVKWMLA
jgi:hypothetical protein